MRRLAGARPGVRVLAALAAVLLMTAPAAAAPRHRASLSDVEDEVMCVVCRIPLNVAQAPEADRERALIRTLIAQGKTKEQIKDELVSQYGERVLATPATSGFDLTAWFVPGLLVLAGLVALAVTVPRWRRSAAPRPASGDPALDPVDSRRLDEELARFDS